MKKNIIIKRISGILAVSLFAVIMATMSCGKPAGVVTPPDDDEDEEEIVIDTSYSRLVCGLVNSINDLPWLKDIFTGKEKPAGNLGPSARIYTYIFKGADVIFLHNPTSSYSPQIVFRCDGTQVVPFTASVAAWTEFYNERTDELLLWKNY